MGKEFFKKTADLLQAKQKKKQYVDTPEEAFAIYKKLKEDNLVYFAEKLAGYMPETVCNALRKWEVNITD